jgi:uncharacterized repeat protein (TIGR03837 family)
MMPSLSIDLFCRVVDNYGDIGVCWRLARCLQRDQGCAVRLFVDDFAVFKRIEPALDRDAAVQNVQNIQILHWTDAVIDRHYGTPADAVIEAFACTLPDNVIAAMTRAETPPVWIDLEYLSAEDWVDTHHAIPSPHPTAGMNKTLFFPGFTPQTGGLIREEGMIRQRSFFQASFAEQNAWRSMQGLPPANPHYLDISLFCYNDAPIPDLIGILEQGQRIPRLFVPQGVGFEGMWQALTPPRTEIHRIPFLLQDDYDRLLWTCDINFVRGEDSFVRAQWAAKPMVWHIYPQAEDHHFVKLRAFLSRYCANLDQECTDLLENFMVLWNERGRDTTGPMERIGPGWLNHLSTLTAHAGNWADHLVRQDDLATRLVRFIRQQKKQ